MPILTLTYNTGTVPLSRIIDAVCSEYRYQSTIPDPVNAGQTIPNPQTKAEFARIAIRTHIENIVKNQEIMQAFKTAESSLVGITLT